MYRLKVQLSLIALLLYYKSIQAELRIINGNNAVPKQFPYQVYIESRINCEFEPNCGGVLISNRTVLTAAHCVRNKKIDAVKIYFGTVDRTNELEMGQQRLIVKRSNIVMHPEYDSEQYLNDIAIIRLPADVQTDEYIQPAKLPDPDKQYENESVVVSGFGTTVGTIKVMSNQLHYYNATVFPSRQCKPIVLKHFPDKSFPTSWLCSAPSRSTTCSGDSGGPLAIQNDDGSHTVLGLVSFGMDAICTNNVPKVFARVSSFLQWIKQNE